MDENVSKETDNVIVENTNETPSVQMPSLYIFKLINGIDIVGFFVDEREDNYLIAEPLVLMEMMHPNGSVSKNLCRYSQHSQQTGAFNKSNVLYIAKADETMYEYYYMSLNMIMKVSDAKLKESVRTASKSIKDHLENINVDSNFENFETYIKMPGFIAGNNTRH